MFRPLPSWVVYVSIGQEEHNEWIVCCFISRCGSGKWVKISTTQRSSKMMLTFVAIGKLPKLENIKNLPSHICTTSKDRVKYLSHFEVKLDLRQHVENNGGWGWACLEHFYSSTSSRSPALFHWLWASSRKRMCLFFYSTHETTSFNGFNEFK